MKYTTINVLLIEDNPGDARLIQEMLADSHHLQADLIIADHLSAGVEHLQQEKTDAILLDLSLPDSSGLDTLDRVMEHTDALPIVVLTGLDDDAIGLAAIALGAQDYLVKGQVDGHLLTRTLTYAIERKQSELALREHEEQLRTVTENSPAGIAIVQDGHYQYVNPSLARILGFPIDEIVGKLGPLSVVHPDDHVTVEDAIRRRQENPQESVQYTCRIQRPDGAIAYCEVLGRSIEYRGRPALMGTIVDVTERKWAEDAERDQRQLAEALSDIASVLSGTLQLHEVLDRILENLGRVVPHDAANISMISGDTAQFIACRGYETWGIDPNAILQIRFPVEEVRILGDMRRSGEPVFVTDTATYSEWNDLPNTQWVRAYLGAPIVQDGVTLGFISLDSVTPGFFTREHAERLRAFANHAAVAIHNAQLYQELENYGRYLELTVEERTAQLQRMNHRLTTILNNTSDAIVLVDHRYRIQNTNPAFDQSFGYQSDGLLDESISHLVGPDHGEQLLKALKAAQETKQPQRLAIPMRRKNGTIFETDAAIAYVDSNGGQTVCSIRDITHLKEVERVKDQFVSMVSHELRTPITTIMLSSSSLYRYYDQLPEERKRKKVMQISQEGEKLSDLVTAILDISRFDARKGQLGQDEVDVARALTEVANELADQAKTKNQQIELEIVNSAMTVQGDHIDMVRVWRNLLTNAIKYTDDGGKIKLALYGARPDNGARHQIPDHLTFDSVIPSDLMTGQYVIGLVEDNGHGMRPQDVDQLFTRFFRGWATNTNIGGTGLGLSLVRDILQLYGGDITVCSELGIGTTFCFWLPVHQVEGTRK